MTETWRLTVLPFLSLISDPPLLPIQGCCTRFSVCDRCFSLNTIIPQCLLIPIGDTHRRVDDDVEWMVVVESQRTKAKLSSPFTNNSKKNASKETSADSRSKTNTCRYFWNALYQDSRLEENAIRGSTRRSFGRACPSPSQMIHWTILPVPSLFSPSFQFQTMVVSFPLLVATTGWYLSQRFALPIQSSKTYRKSVGFSDSTESYSLLTFFDFFRSFTIQWYFSRDST